jgi:hypothetical protein
MEKLSHPPEFHEKEVNIDRQLFNRSPVLAISRFLECFSSEGGDQRFEVPRHVLEFLAASFAQFMGGGVESLDVAFGGKTKRQRHTIKFEKRDYEIVFELRVAVEAFKKKPRAARGKSTPFELAAVANGKIPSSTIARSSARSWPPGSRPEFSSAERGRPGSHRPSFGYRPLK